MKKKNKVAARAQESRRPAAAERPAHRAGMVGQDHVGDVSRGLQRALCLLREGQDEAFIYEVTVTMGAYAQTERARSRIRRTFMRIHKGGEA